MSLIDEDIERFVEAEANKNTQRKMHSDVVLMKSFKVVFDKWNETRRTISRHTAARIRRLLQQIHAIVGGIIAFVERYPKNLRYSESIIKGQRSTVELCERHLFKQVFQARDETVDQFVWRLRQRAASCDF